MEERLAAALASRPQTRAASANAAPIARPVVSPKKEDAPRATVAAEPAAMPASLGEERIAFDEAAESAFLAEAKDRGEVVKPRAAEAVDAVEEVETKPLPPLDELVQRIPAEVRDTLEDLFRAKFVTVKRLPKKALKK